MNKAPKRELLFKEPDQQAYAAVIKLLGNGRMMVRLLDGAAQPTEKQCTVRGSMRKREWVNMNDVVLVAFREFGDTHDIIRRYTEEEVSQLKKAGELDVVPLVSYDQDDGIVFEDVDAI
jgi:initiation factor 1A